MRAVVRDVYGGPDVLRTDDIPMPVLTDDGVLVRVRATSINDYDWHLLTGQPAINRIGALRRPRHRVLGADVAGIVESVGGAVTALRPGDEVYADLSMHGFGGCADYVGAPASAFARKPASLSFEQAAAVPQAGGLAVVGLRGKRPIRPGDRVLVNGAGGGVGTLAVQIAHAAGAVVTGVDAAWKLEVVRAVGADHVIDYATEDVFRSGRIFDRILNIAAHHSLSTYRSVLAPGGYCGLTGGSIPRVLAAMAIGPVTSMWHDSKIDVPRWRPNDPTDVAYLAALLESGQVAPVIDSVRPLEELPEAFRRFGAQQHTGKIVITVSS
jgi:NADPH:quinone reductase-like Zn-dependent oxidoreductase